jgi:hypothetical protein
MFSLAISMSAMSIASRAPMSSLSKTTSATTIIKTTGASGEGRN